MLIDLTTVPFSCRGSWMAISMLPAGWNGLQNCPGLYLRTIHSSARTPLVARLIPEIGGITASFSAELQDAALSLKCGGEALDICFDDPDTMVFRASAGLTLTVDFLCENGPYDYIYSFSRGDRAFHMANCYKNNCRYLICAEQGEATLDQAWQESSSIYSRLRFSGAEGFCFAWKEIETEWDGRWKTYRFEESRTVMAQSLQAFQSGLPVCPPKYAEAAAQAGYLLWSSMVRSDGFLSREAMLMSKNWMTSVWSWDHCFNAIALSHGAPALAWEQFMLLFDFQDPTGLLPDSVNDVHVVWNYCKPPIHGWALRKMLQHMTLTSAQTCEVYERLSRWTNWWRTCRDYDGDDLYAYNHGNDSGWDNSTAFATLPPVITPELQAFLVIQMDVLAELAAALGRSDESAEWKKEADALLERLLASLFVDDLPVVRRSGTHEIVQNSSLLPYVSIVLGERLPERAQCRIATILSGSVFRTSHGFATESTQSPCYRSDGYWRGPIWAPSTMLIVDGLMRCGKKDLVIETVRQFADMVNASGFAENFDAMTGQGLRDRAYTWTASVFLTMASEIL